MLLGRPFVIIMAGSNTSFGFAHRVMHHINGISSSLARAKASSCGDGKNNTLFASSV